MDCPGRCGKGVDGTGKTGWELPGRNEVFFGVLLLQVYRVRAEREAMARRVQYEQQQQQTDLAQVGSGEMQSAASAGHAFIELSDG